jgi:carboxypeptidase family protein
MSADGKSQGKWEGKTMPHARLDSCRSVFLGGLALFLLGGCLSAQIDQATITGTVIDPSGAVVPGAKIEAVAQATSLRTEATTNSKGVYLVPGLAVGKYDVTASHAGFGTVQYKDVSLTVGETRTINVHLKVGAIRETMEVKAPLSLDETSPELSGVIDTEEIQSIPVNGRNWASLLLLAPGAIDDGGGDQRTIRFAGRARDDNNYTMDGVDALRRQQEDQRHHLPFSKEESFGASDRFIRRKGAQVC